MLPLQQLPTRCSTARGCSDDFLVVARHSGAARWRRSLAKLNCRRACVHRQWDERNGSSVQVGCGAHRSCSRLRAVQTDAARAEQRCFSATLTRCGAERSVSPQVLGGVVASLGLSCLTLSQQAPDGPAATSRQRADFDSRRPLDVEDEATNDALKQQWRSSAGRRQREATPVASNSPKSADMPPIDGVFGVDIGGTLAKLVFLEKVDDTGSSKHTGAGKRRPNFITAQERFGTTGKRHTDLQFPCERLGGVLHFIKFETRCVSCPAGHRWRCPCASVSLRFSHSCTHCLKTLQTDCVSIGVWTMRCALLRKMVWLMGWSACT